MSKIEITGASQRINRTRNDLYSACYVCHKCGEEFAYSDDFCRNEAEAREQSDTVFDRIIRKFCCICGYKLTTKEPSPEDEYIAALNYQIDKLEEHQRVLIDKINKLDDTIKREIGFYDDFEILEASNEGD